MTSIALGRLSSSGTSKPFTFRTMLKSLSWCPRRSWARTASASPASASPPSASPASAGPASASPPSARSSSARPSSPKKEVMLKDENGELILLIGFS